MLYNHVGVYVSDVDKSLELYCDILGFVPVWDSVFPNEMMSQELVDACFKTTGARFRDVLAQAPEGHKIELLQPIDPPMRRTPRENLGYPNTGVMEIALDVTDIDAWLVKITEAGYETQTDFVWEIPGALRSFLFHDHDGNLIQLVEETVVASAT